MDVRIPKKMKAVVCHGPHDYRLEEIPVPQVGDGDVLVKVKACGICAGDVKSRAGASMFWGDEIQPPYNKPPVVAGHEFFGTVVALGKGAKEKHGLDIGDTVTAEQIVPCGKCRFCRNGSYWMCEVHNIHGFQREVADGGMAEYVRLSDRDIIHKVPESIAGYNGAIIEPLACAVHSVERAQIRFGDVVVIGGLGPIGLLKLQLARLKNPGLLIGIDLREKRLELGKELGADIVLNPLEDDVKQRVMEVTDGYGCDVYIHNTGNPKGVIQGLQILRKLGTFVEFSVFTEPTTVDWSIIGDRKELNIYGAHLSPYTYPIAIDFLAKGLVKGEPIITHSFPLEQWEEAFTMAEEGTESIKVVLVP